MKIVVCTTADLTGAVILNHVLPCLPGASVRVFLAMRRRPTDDAVPSLREQWQRERTYPLETLFPQLERLSPEGGDDLLTFGQLQRRFDVPMTTVCDVEEWRRARLPAYEADAVFSARFGFLFPFSLIERLPGRVLNLHPSALPMHKGQFPVLRALAAGDRELGCTLHHASASVDAGDVVFRTSMAVVPGRSNLWHLTNLYAKGAELIGRAAEMIRTGEPLPAERQGEDGAALDFPSEDEIRAAEARGWPISTPRDYEELLVRFRSGTAFRKAAQPLLADQDAGTLRIGG